jgi:FlaA1/EpsC-like NDP-sugar epimerase
MLDTNVLAARRLLGWLAELGGTHYFAVSTDKAANPVNLMGASKRAMELVMFDPRLPQAVSSARFANVAFSNGSLLDGWLRRLERRQPWAVPTGTRRYFVSAEESGQLCLLAATVAADRTIVIPDLDPAEHLRDLVEIAEATLRFLGLEPVWCTTENEARSRMGESAGSDGWPVLLTPLDTTGEKEFEEFIGVGDELASDRFEHLRGLRTRQPSAEVLDDFLARAADMLTTEGTVSSDDLVDCLHRLVPELDHNRSDKGLDARM